VRFTDGCFQPFRGMFFYPIRPLKERKEVPQNLDPFSHRRTLHRPVRLHLLPQLRPRRSMLLDTSHSSSQFLHKSSPAVGLRFDGFHSFFHASFSPSYIISRRPGHGDRTKPAGSRRREEWAQSKLKAKRQWNQPRPAQGTHALVKWDSFIHSGELRRVGRRWRGGRATGRRGVR
jgi:hypothetical protein